MPARHRQTRSERHDTLGHPEAEAVCHAPGLARHHQGQDRQPRQHNRGFRTLSVLKVDVDLSLANFPGIGHETWPVLCPDVSLVSKHRCQRH